MSMPVPASHYPLGPPPAEGWEPPRSKCAGNLAFEDPADLYDALNDFARKIENERLMEFRPLAKRDVWVPKAALPTIEGLRLHLGINRSTWWHMTQRTDVIGDICQRYKDWAVSFTLKHAAAGLLDGAIVSRYLGLADRTQIDATVNDMQWTATEEAAKAVGDYHAATLVHTDDPDPLGLVSGIWPRPLYSQAQLDAGMPFHPPAPSATEHPQIIEHEPIGETEHASEISGIHDDVETAPDPGGVRGVPRLNAR